ncbi:MAG: SEC-C domain-containing protein [Bacilli bacterium]|nr:SEC-C domain-containing protein [Bacilli bacterium]
MYVTSPQTVANKGNIDSIDNTNNTHKKPACGSGKKYKQCHGK